MDGSGCLLHRQVKREVEPDDQAKDDVLFGLWGAKLDGAFRPGKPCGSVGAGGLERENRVAAKVICMTLHGGGYEVGVRELHDRLSEHLERVERGAEIMVTRRGQPIARLSAVDGEDPLEDLVRRGLITPPSRARSVRRARVRSRGSASDLVSEQRR